MLTPKPSVTQSAPDISTTPAVDFNKDDFEDLIQQKGDDVYHEKAIRCACRTRNSGGHQALSDCKNCRGSGWIFINRTQTKMVLSSMSYQTKYAQWSEQKLGTVNITARDVDKLGEMDRITVLQGETVFSETVHPVFEEGQLFSFTAYDIVKLEFAFMFKNSQSKLILLQEGTDFTLVDNKILLNKNKNEDAYNISLRYVHRPTYHVIDLTRDAMITDIASSDGKRNPTQMPIHGVGRRAHYVPDAPNLDGTGVFDNSTVQYTNVACKV